MSQKDSTHNMSFGVKRNSKRQHVFPDCCELKHLSLDSICRNLELRYLSAPSEFYSWVGTILISINPYTSYPEKYDEAAKEFYSGSLTKSSRHPHVYAVGERLHRFVLHSNARQSVIISGESGAGKTEVCQSLINYLGFASVKASSAPLTVLTPRIYSIENLLAASTRLLEVFGNAKTLSNNNSSRFGKLTTVQFDHAGRMTHAKVRTYMLGTSRVTHVIPQEQSFHAFHLLFQSKPQFRPWSAYVRERATDYRYLKNIVPGDKDSQADAMAMTVPPHLNLRFIEESFDRLGVTEKEQNMLWAILVGILELGNIQFKPSEDSQYTDQETVIVDLKHLRLVAELLGLSDASGLKAILVKQKVRENFKAFSVKKAEENRDSIARFIYDKLFEYLVAKVNTALGGDKTEHDSEVPEVDVLDIYGFENVTCNSLDQLCINYANEKLQQFFATQLILREKEVYSLEGVCPGAAVRSNDNSIYMETNENLIEFFEGVDKRPGFFSILWDEARFPGDHDRDQHFCKQVSNLTVKLKLQKDTLKFNEDKKFIVAHSFAEVKYDGNEFVKKDQETLTEDSTILLQCSQHIILSAGSNNRSEVIRKSSASMCSNFSFSLKALQKRLETSSNCSFIRCLKPNDKQRSNYFDTFQVKKQLEASGFRSIIQIMSQGFPCRQPIERIVTQFGAKLSGTKLGSLKPRLQAELLLSMAGAVKGEFAIGTTQVFFRHGQIEAVEKCISASPQDLESMIKSLRKRQLKAVFIVVILAVRFTRQETKRRQATTKIQATIRCIRAEREFISLIGKVEGLQRNIRRAFFVLTKHKERSEISMAKQLDAQAESVELEVKEKPQVANRIVNESSTKEKISDLASSTPSPQNDVLKGLSPQAIICNSQQNGTTENSRSKYNDLSTEGLKAYLRETLLVKGFDGKPPFNNFTESTTASTTVLPSGSATPDFRIPPEKSAESQRTSISGTLSKNSVSSYKLPNDSASSRKPATERGRWQSRERTILARGSRDGSGNVDLGQADANWRLRENNIGRHDGIEQTDMHPRKDRWRQMRHTSIDVNLTSKDINNAVPQTHKELAREDRSRRHFRRASRRRSLKRSQSVNKRENLNSANVTNCNNQTNQSSIMREIPARTFGETRTTDAQRRSKQQQQQQQKQQQQQQDKGPHQPSGRNLSLPPNSKCASVYSNNSANLLRFDKRWVPCSEINKGLHKSGNDLIYKKAVDSIKHEVGRDRTVACAGVLRQEQQQASRNSKDHQTRRIEWHPSDNSSTNDKRSNFDRGDFRRSSSNARKNAGCNKVNPQTSKPFYKDNFPLPLPPGYKRRQEPVERSREVNAQPLTSEADNRGRRPNRSRSAKRRPSKSPGRNRHSSCDRVLQKQENHQNNYHQNTDKKISRSTSLSRGNVIILSSPPLPEEENETVRKQRNRSRSQRKRT